ncbi:ketoacyl-synthetase-like protein [Nonomuraea fuscirosea]|uniref:Ketoacyl-synthetase-like protein n=1 Tax=Nonomuraea fuscirosea TaxID=1291556 RepID=A0A2T0N5G8_9ACTN|nr:type I polyketide synthase [Nonomuraea fuscirosea]PRX67613.1 ketoacyl-synthetase-like protein [Nonomuraea fuscirosea]
MSDLVEPIAIIGMAGRFPGAAGTRQLWELLVAGEEAVRFPAEDELRSRGVSPEALADPAYVRAVAEPEGIDLFDAGFFGLTRREADVCDPQLRLYLETAHAAVENAGYDATRLGRAGVFSSVAANRYGIGRILANLEALRSATGMGAGMWNNPDSASTLVSYKLNLNGPSLTVQTACSSSLVAVHLAVNALRLRECDVALAGGADVEFPVGHGYRWAQDGPLSRDGHCRPFAAAATGTVFGSGAGVVVLKRLADALGDGDRISAVIRSVAVNNDGAHKVGFTAPSADRQAEVVARAMELAGVGPADIGYVEAHATATRLGDAIEIAGLRMAFGARAASRAERCPIGSIKGNVGHLGHAAGITSLIKTALSLSHERIPATVNLDEVNPLLDLDSSPFLVNDTLRSWPRAAGRRRLAGVSSFGIGGTNAHAILEEAPARPAVPGRSRQGGGHTGSRPEPTRREPAELIVWSARTPAAAAAWPERLARAFAGSAEPLAGVAFTLREGRTPHPVRGAVVVESLADAAAAVLDEGRRIVTPPEWAERSTVFLFPGERAWHAGMAAELRRTEPVFRAALDECVELFEAHGLPLRPLWEGTREAAQDRPVPDGADVRQSAVFSVEYALGRLWQALGIEPDVLLGLGVGEFAAATLAGVFTLQETVRLVSAKATGGSSTDDAAGRFRTAFDGIRPRRPRAKICSTAAGGLVEPAQAGSADFWLRLLDEPALFERALDAVLSDGDRVLVEMGPGRSLTTLARAHPQVRAGRHLVVPVLPAGPSKGATERASFLYALGRMWTLGAEVNWSPLSASGPRERVPLPGYPYQRERHWIDLEAPHGPAGRTPAHQPNGAPAHQPTGQSAHETSEAHAREAGGAALRLPTWVEAAPAPRHGSGIGHGSRPLVFLPDDPRRAAELTALLDRAGWDATRVRHASAYASSATDSMDRPGCSENDFTIRPGHSEDVVRLLDELRESRRYPELVVDATQLGALAEPDLSTIDDQLDAGFHRFVDLLQEAARRAPDRRGRDVLVITELSADVTGGERVHPVRAMLLGLLRSYMLENPRSRCKLIDVQDGVGTNRLLAELRGFDHSEIVALRGDRRWIPEERPLPLDDTAPDVAPRHGAASNGADARGVGSVGLRRGGVYVITGGLGGLGLAVARGLAETGMRPRLLLLGRRTGGHEAELAEIKGLGAECRVETCDVTDVEALRRVIGRASDSFGGVNGVFHLAGVAGDGMIPFRTREQMRATLAPKVHGTLALIEVLRDQAGLDFFVAFSSRAALRGLVGGADYAAANAFLDAVVRRQPLAGCASVSVNWPSWTEVGMAARQERHPHTGRPGQIAGTGPNVATEVEPGSGPEAGVAVRRWSVSLSAESYPILDEHRMEGVPVLPGTAQVDFVLRAFREAVGNVNGRPERVRHMVFRQPITTPEPVSLEVGFEPHEDVWRFTVRTAPLSSSSGSPSDHRVHTTGEIGLVDATAGTVDLDGLRASLTDRRTPVNDPANRLFTIGPRWPGEEIWTSGDDPGTKLAVLTFSDAFSHELGEHALHPTLLDAAVSLARDPDLEPPHAPFAYQSIVVHRPIPGRAYSHIRRRPSGPDTIVADIDVLTADGEVAVEVRGFTMRRVDESMVASDIRREERGAAITPDISLGRDAAAGPVPSSGRRHFDAGPQLAPGDAITPATGIGLLLRLLARPEHRQVAVTVPGHDAVLKNAVMGDGAGSSGGRPGSMSGAPASVDTRPSAAGTRSAAADTRPTAPGTQPISADAQSTAAGAPSAVPQGLSGGAAQGQVAVEDRLVEMWCAEFGLEEVGLDENFFDLGGDSFAAVGLVEEIRRAFSVDVGIAVIFDHPTVAELAAELRRLGE